MFSVKIVMEDMGNDFLAFNTSIKNSTYYAVRESAVCEIDYKTKEVIDTINLNLSISDLKLTKCGGFLLVGFYDNITGIVVDMKTKTTISLNGHTDVIRCIIECEDTHVLTCSNDTTIRLWNRLTGECIRIYSGHSSWVRSIVYDKKTKRIFSASDDHTIRVWKSETDEQIGVMKGHSSYVISLAVVNATTIVSGSYDKTVKIWDVTTMKEIKTMSSHTDFVISVAVTPDEKYVISASFDKSLRIWSVATGELVFTIHLLRGYVKQIAVSADGKYIFVGFFYEKGCQIYEVEPALKCIVHEFHAQIDIKPCTLKLLSDGTIVNEKGERI